MVEEPTPETVAAERPPEIVPTQPLPEGIADPAGVEAVAAVEEQPVAPAAPEAEEPPAPTLLERIVPTVIAVPAATALELGAPAIATAVDDEPAPTVLEIREPVSVGTEGSAESAAAGPAAPAATALEEAPPPAATVVEQAWSAREAHEGELLLGLYEVLGVLGQGGMGRVFRVRHRGWGLDLAVKAPLPAVLEATGGADLFEREAETWVNLGLHPHVVTCHYVRRVDGVPLVFAEYVDGGSLHDALRKGRLDSSEAILDVAVQAAWGLHHAHEQGLVHRDVKPANVLLTADGVAKVTDFGLARARPARVVLQPGAEPGQTMTVEGGGGGTPAYASPEQARGEAMSRRSDLWSFALVVLELFLGRRTWSLGVAAAEVMAAFRREGLGAAGRPRMPLEVAAALERCFADSPEDRPHDLAELAGVLRTAWEAAARRPFPRSEPRGGTGSADALNNRAVSLVDLGRAAEAAALWRRALDAEPQHVEATYNSVLAAWGSAALADPEAARRIEEAATTHASSARAQQLAARVHLALGQAAEASAALARAATLGGGDELAADVAAASRPPQPPKRTVRLPAPASALALAPDGRTVFAGSGSDVRVWDAQTGQLGRTLTAQGGTVRALLAAADGQQLLIGAERSTLTSWDLASGRLLRSFERHAGHATCLAAIPRSTIVVEGGSDRTLRFYDTGTGRCLREIVAHEDAVTAVSAGSDVVASASRDGSVRLWDTAEGRQLAKLVLPTGRPLAVVVDESQSRLLVASDDGVLRDYGLESRELARAWVSHALAVPALALSPDGALLLSGSADRTLRVFDADGEKLLAKAHLDAGVQALVLAPDGTVWASHGAAVSAVQPAPLALPAPALCRPASASEEETRAALFEAQLAQARRSYQDDDLRTAVQLARVARAIPGHERAPAAVGLWDELSGRLPRRGLASAWEEGVLALGRDPLLGVALEAGARRALAAAFDGSVVPVDLALRQPLPALGRHDGAATAVSFAGPRLAVSGGRDRTLRVWDLAGRRAPAVLEGHGETVTAVDARQDGTRAVSASADGTVRVWDLRALSISRVLEGHRAQVAGVRLSSDGLVAASAGWDGTARLWDVDTGSQLAVLEGHEASVTALALHPAGRQVATGCEDGSIRVFDTVNRRVLRRLEGHRGAVAAVAFTADGRFLLSCSRDASVRAWDLRRGCEIRALSHPAPVTGLALAATAGLLLSSGHDGSLRAWRLDWDLDPEGAGTTTAPANVPLVESLRAGGGHPTRSAVVREELRRAAPAAPVQALPEAVGGMARHWKKIALALVLVAVVAGGWLASRKPAPRLRLSAHMARELSREPDLVDVRGSAAQGCAEADYESQLERVVSGNPTSTEIACVATAGRPGLVGAVLDGGTPLANPDPMATRRLRRNAASVLSALEAGEVEALCSRLGDGREEVRLVAATALAVIADPAAGACVRGTLESAEPASSGPAVLALRLRLARRLTSVEDGWATAQSLLRAPSPQVRREGLRLLEVFSYGSSLPAAQALLQDPDPEVAEAARRTVTELEGIRRSDQLLGDTAP